MLIRTGVESEEFSEVYTANKDICQGDANRERTELMIRQCAWCLCLINCAGERLSSSPLPKLYEASHGICIVCGIQWIARATENYTSLSQPEYQERCPVSQPEYQEQYMSQTTTSPTSTAGTLSDFQIAGSSTFYHPTDS